MSIQKEIKAKFDRSVSILSQKPEKGISTLVSTTRVINGLACEATEGNWIIKADLPSQVGGTETGPTPGVYGRAALGSCLAMGYMLWASKLEVPIDSLEVDIQADSDDGGLFGCSDTRPGYSEVRYCVRVQSSAPEEDLFRVFDEGDRHSPYLDIFANSVVCNRSIEIVGRDSAG